VQTAGLIGQTAMLSDKFNPLDNLMSAGKWLGDKTGLTDLASGAVDTVKEALLPPGEYGIWAKKTPEGLEALPWGRRPADFNTTTGTYDFSNITSDYTTLGVDSPVDTITKIPDDIGFYQINEYGDIVGARTPGFGVVGEGGFTQIGGNEFIPVNQFSTAPGQALTMPGWSPSLAGWAGVGAGMGMDAVGIAMGGASSGFDAYGMSALGGSEWGVVDSAGLSLGGEASIAGGTGAVASTAGIEGIATGASMAGAAMGIAGGASIGRGLANLVGSGSTTEDIGTIGGGAIAGFIVGGPMGSVIGAVIGGAVDFISDSLGSIICTELSRQGFLNDKLLFEDHLWREFFVTDKEFRGYNRLARPVVKLMQKSRLFTYCMVPFVHSFALEAASRVNVKYRKDSNLLGKLIIKIGLPICRRFGNG